jgi:hypothetical protein
MRVALAVSALVALSLGVSARPTPHRLNKPGSHDSELNDPVAQGVLASLCVNDLSNEYASVVAVGNKDGKDCGDCEYVY